MLNHNLKPRKPNRLKSYDYSQNGAYFVTVCVQNKLCLFGDVLDGEMVLNDAGTMIKKWWLKLEDKFLGMVCDVFVVMPNHFHGIVVIDNSQINIKSAVAVVGTDPRVCPSSDVPHVCPEKNLDKHVLNNLDKHVLNNLDKNVLNNLDKNVLNNTDKHMGLSLPNIMQWFKTMTTNEYIRGVKNKHWDSFDKKLWQRSYYDHIIRNAKALEKIRKYIIENPIRWECRDKSRPVQ